jgi:hypothetical protein
MKALRDHADTGVQQPYEVPYLSECIVMNSHSLIDPLVGERRGAEIRCCVGRFSHLRRMVAWGVARALLRSACGRSFCFA